MSSVPTITLNNGVTIPQLGFGTYQIEPENTKQAVLDALEIGYRHIDTAQMYGNEAEVGEAVKASGIARDEIFVTSKLNNGFHDPADAAKAIDDSLSKMGFDALDLFLIHWPMPEVGDYLETWKALETMLEQGKTRAIGVSNFQPAHLRRLSEAGTTTPAVNQVEVHPFFVQDEVRSFCAEQGIEIEAWSPIAQGKVLDDDVLKGIAEATGKSTAQVTLRWQIQRGDIIFPKSVTKSRVQENFDIFDFELTPEQMADVTGLDQGADGRQGPNPDEMNMVP